MKNIGKLATHLLTGACAVFALAAVEASGFVSGEAGFREHCAPCDAGGGNILNPAKTLSQADREKNGVRTAEDIVKIMRKPGEDMTTFDEKAMPDGEANLIAEYIISTFR